MREIVARRLPEAATDIVAADHDRGWPLLPDARAALRDLVAAERSVERWLDVLPLFARLQRACEGTCRSSPSGADVERRHTRADSSRSAPVGWFRDSPMGAT